MGLAHGTIGWADVAVPDTDAAAAFYNAVLGWDAANGSAEAADYVMFSIGGKVVAGMGKLSEDQVSSGQPAVWSTYVIVDDLDAIHERATELGATILLEPTEILDAGWMMYALDPVGAPIGFWQSGTHDGAEVFNEVGSMTWNDLGCRDRGTAAAFYADLLGWEFENMDMGDDIYTVFKIGERPNAGVWDITGTLPDDVPPHWLTWFRVADTAATAARAVEMGGSVISEPSESPMGVTAIIADPAGATFAVISTDQVDGQPPR